MLFDILHRSTSTMSQLFEFLFSVALNILAIPLSFLYSLATTSASDNWKFIRTNETYVLWWSHRRGELKCNKGGLPEDIAFPRTLLVMFLVLVPLLIVVRCIILIAEKISQTQQPPKKQEASVPRSDKDLSSTKRRSSSRR